MELKTGRQSIDREEHLCFAIPFGIQKYHLLRSSFSVTSHKSDECSQMMLEMSFMNICLLALIC